MFLVPKNLIHKGGGAYHNFCRNFFNEKLWVFLKISGVDHLSVARIFRVNHKGGITKKMSKT